MQTQFYYQSTQPKIEMLHWTSNSEDRSVGGIYITFSAKSENTSGTGLQSYTFTRSTKQLVGNFSITVREDKVSKDSANKTFLDQVRPFDIIKIYENDSDSPSFIGLVSNISFGAVAGALSKIITVSGKSIEGLFDMYKLSLDITAMSLQSSEALNVDFTDELYSVKSEKIQETTEEPIKLKEGSDEKTQRENIKTAFDCKNLEMIKKAYKPISAEFAYKSLIGSYSSNDIVGILSNAGGSVKNLAKAASITEKEANNLKSQYIDKVKKLNEVPTQTVTKEITVSVEKPVNIKDVVLLTIGHLHSVMVKHPKVGTTEIYNLMKYYYDIEDNISTKKSEEKIRLSKMNLDCDIKFNYPIVCNIFSNSTIKIFNYIRNLLPDNIYEIFGTVKKGKPYIVIREVPYGTLVNDDKSEVDVENLSNPEKTYKESYSQFLELYDTDYNLTGDLITDYTFTLSNEQVYTAFLSYLEGSALSSEQCLSMTASDKGYQTARATVDKLKIYGYNLLKANFVGYNENTISRNSKDNKQKAQSDIISIFNFLNQKLQMWYGKLDEMYTGDVTVIQVKDKNYPQIGEVCKVCGAYFYITAESHSWRYGDVAKINYKLDRGGMYTEDEFKKIKGLSKQYSELEI